MADASNVFKVRSGHVGYLAKLTKEAATLLQDHSDDQRLGFLTYAIKDQDHKYRRVTDKCITKSSDKQLFDLKVHDENVYTKVNELSAAIGKYLGENMPEPPSPEQLAQDSPDVPLEEETEVLKTQDYKQEQAPIETTNKEKSKGEKAPSMKKPRSVKPSSKCSSTSTTASEKRAKAQVEAQLAALKLEQK